MRPIEPGEDIRHRTMLLYEMKFGQELNFPPLDYGHVSMDYDELVQYAVTALAVGKPVDWSEHFDPLPPGCLS